MLRQALYVAFILFIIGGVWVLGWAHSMDDQVRDYYQPNDPELFDYSRQIAIDAVREAAIEPPRRNAAAAGAVTLAHDVGDW